MNLDPIARIPLASALRVASPIIEILGVASGSDRSSSEKVEIPRDYMSTYTCMLIFFSRACRIISFSVFDAIEATYMP